MPKVSIGDIRKLDERPVVVIGTSENGNDVQVDHWSEFPWTPVVHVDRLSDMPPWAWTSETLAELQSQALRCLGTMHESRGLALGTIALIDSHRRLADEKRIEGAEAALQDEGAALDDVLRELEAVKAELAECRTALGKHVNHVIPTAASIEMLAETLESRTISLSGHKQEHDEIARELERTKDDLDEARIIAEKATQIAEALATSSTAMVNLLRDAFARASIEGFAIAPNADVMETIGKTIDAIQEFGILNRELLAVGKAIAGVVPPNKNGERISVTVGRVVAMLAERDVELMKLRKEVVSRENTSDAIVPAPTPTMRKFTREYLRNDLSLPGGKNSLHDAIIETTRWSIVYECVLKTPELPDGYGWETSYSVGATECQDERPWQNEEEVECTLVRRGTKTVEAWIPAVLPSPDEPPKSAKRTKGTDHLHEIGSCICDTWPSTAPTTNEQAHVLAAMDGNVHVPNDEHMANVEAAIADELVIMGADPAQVYSAEQFRASAHAQLTTPAEPLALSPNATRVLDHLRGYVGTEGGQRGSALRDALKLSPSDWNKAKDELMDARLIKSDGKGRGTVYSAVAR